MSARPPLRLSVQAWCLLFALGLALWLAISNAGLILEVIWILLGALLISLVVGPIADFISHRHIPRGLAVLVAYLVIGLPLVVVGALVVPVFMAEISSLRTGGPTLLQDALTRLAAAPLLDKLVPSTSTLAQSLLQRVDSLVSPVVSAVEGVGGLLLDLLVVVILGYFFATDTGIMDRLLEAFMPVTYRDSAHVVVSNTHRRLTRWIWSQLAVALYFAVTFGVGLMILQVPFAFTIALVGGLLEVVPYLGSAVAIVLAARSALTVKPLLVVWVAILFVAVVEFKGHVIEPTVYGRLVGLHPAVVVIALVVGAKAQGILGVLFAVPVTVIIGAVIQEARAQGLGTEETGGPPEGVGDA